MKPTLLILNPTCLDVVEEHRDWARSQGMELLATQSLRNAREDELVEALKKADGVVLPAPVRTMPTEQQMLMCPQLKVCAIAASGYEWLDVQAATRHGIVVCFAPGGAGAEVVAEMAIGLLFAVVRQIPFHHHRLSVGDQTRGMGTSVFGKTLGIIGLGSIGKEVAQRARGLKMRLVAFDPSPDQAFAAEHSIELLPLADLLSTSDVVSLHVRLTPETKRMIGAQELTRMKPSAVLINTARHELVDEDALVAALLRGRLAGAGLDDPPGLSAQKLLRLPNVVFTPHLGNRAIEGVHSVFRAAMEGALQVFRGERPRYIVNPDVYQRPLRAPQCDLSGSQT